MSNSALAMKFSLLRSMIFRPKLKKNMGRRTFVQINSVNFRNERSYGQFKERKETQ